MPKQPPKRLGNSSGDCNHSGIMEISKQVHNLENDLREVTDSIVGKVERIPLMVDNIDLEEIFINYCDRCENIFDLCNSHIMDMRPSSHFMREIMKESWSKFVLDTYPEHNIPKGWKYMSKSKSLKKMVWLFIFITHLSFNGKKAEG
ncbi:unnamed protein product [Rhizophagus irregularis]|nr:unnamed protein product [Rhizophagus irregularis]CAB5362923.1 unnamed protein product [Rhizophagus irregularis]